MLCLRMPQYISQRAHTPTGATITSADAALRTPGPCARNIPLRRQRGRRRPIRPPLLLCLQLPRRILFIFAGVEGVSDRHWPGGTVSTPALDGHSLTRRELVTSILVVDHAVIWMVVRPLALVLGPLNLHEALGFPRRYLSAHHKAQQRGRHCKQMDRVARSPLSLPPCLSPNLRWILFIFRIQSGLSKNQPAGAA